MDQFFSAEFFSKLPLSDRDAFLDAMSEEEADEFRHDWEFWARPDQLIPTWRPWVYWLPLAGRGWGKTRVGAETVRQWIKKYRRVNLIGATVDDVREIMVEGESGILNICPKRERPRYIANKRRLEWPNGAVSLLFSAEEPERFRGKQHMKLWCDELAAWRYSESWDQAALGLRLGDNPQAIITTTPRPIKIIKDLLADPDTLVTRHSTYENRDNLAPAFIAKIIRRYEGTRLGRQELDAEILEDTPGALWNRAIIEETRVLPKSVPALKRIVVAIDPAATSGEDADETGIICAGIAENGHGYVLEDSSGRYSPTDWAKQAVALHKARKGDRIVAEVNNGGEMVESTIRIIDPNAPYRAVHASRGKTMRAEPVSALYEQKRIHHVGMFAKLEDQMCSYSPDFDRSKAESPDRMDALVWAFTDLMVTTDYGGMIDYYARLVAEKNEREAAAAAAAKSGGIPSFAGWG